MAVEALLNMRAAGQYTGMPTSAIGHAAALDPPRLRGYKTGPDGRWYFRRSDLDAWMASMDNAPADAPQQPAKKRRTRQKVNN
jgi:hypothetical protein